MLFTLGEMIIVIIAFILITYYIFSVKLCKDEKIDDNFVEDMSGNLSNKTVLMRINEQNENYPFFKEILDINNYKRYSKNNIKLWIPFFAYDISLYDTDIDNAKNINESEKIFIEILYPKIISRCLNIIEIIEKIKILFNNETTIINSCNIYINYIKSYLIRLVSTYLNETELYELQNLQQNESKIVKIHTLLISLSNKNK